MVVAVAAWRVGPPAVFPRRRARRFKLNPVATLSGDEDGSGGGGGGKGRLHSSPSATRWPDCPLTPRPRWPDDRYELIVLQKRMTATMQRMDAKAASGDFAGALAERDGLLPLQLRERHLLLQARWSLLCALVWHVGELLLRDCMVPLPRTTACPWPCPAQPVPHHPDRAPLGKTLLHRQGMIVQHRRHGYKGVIAQYTRDGCGLLVPSKRLQVRGRDLRRPLRRHALGAGSLGAGSLGAATADTSGRASWPITLRCPPASSAIALRCSAR